MDGFYLFTGDFKVQHLIRTNLTFLDEWSYTRWIVGR